MTLGRKLDSVLLRESAALADDVRAAVKSSIDLGETLAAIRLHFFDAAPPTPEQARDWARANIPTDTRKLSAALDKLYSVGWALGHDYAHTAVYEATRARRKAVAPDPRSIVSDWATWKPGLESAELLVRPPGGLQALLDRKPVTIKGMDETALNRIGTVIADGLSVGAGDLSMVRDLNEIIRSMSTGIEAIVGDSSRALSIATTEMNRAVSVATTENYADLGVERQEWFALDTDDDCSDNADAGPVPLGEEFPSGDTEPPAHPNCRCSLLPWIEDDSEQVRPETPDGEGDGAEIAGAEAVEPAALDMPDEIEAPDTAGDIPEPEASSSGGLDIPSAEELLTALASVEPYSEAAKQLEATVTSIYANSGPLAGFSLGDLTAYAKDNVIHGLRAISAKGTIFDSEGRVAGYFGRNFYTGPSGEKIVQHDYLELKKEYRGKGFSTGFSKFSEDWYRQAGFDRIDLTAGLSNGAYTWAKAGYTWNREYYVGGILPDAIISRLEKLIGEGVEPAALQPILKALSAGAPDSWPEPFEIANLSTAQYPTLGKMILNATDWEGTKKL